jgi:hypothetical protein
MAKTIPELSKNKQRIPRWSHSAQANLARNERAGRETDCFQGLTSAGRIVSLVIGSYWQGLCLNEHKNRWRRQTRVRDVIRTKSGFIVLPSHAKPLKLAAMNPEFGHEDAARKKSSKGA